MPARNRRAKASRATAAYRRRLSAHPDTGLRNDVLLRAPVSDVIEHLYQRTMIIEAVVLQRLCDLARSIIDAHLQQRQQPRIELGRARQKEKGALPHGKSGKKGDAKHWLSTGTNTASNGASQVNGRQLHFDTTGNSVFHGATSSKSHDRSYDAHLERGAAGPPRIATATCREADGEDSKRAPTPASSPLDTQSSAAPIVHPASILHTTAPQIHNGLSPQDAEAACISVVRPAKGHVHRGLHTPLVIEWMSPPSVRRVTIELYRLVDSAIGVDSDAVCCKGHQGTEHESKALPSAVKHYQPDSEQDTRSSDSETASESTLGPMGSSRDWRNGGRHSTLQLSMVLAEEAHNRSDQPNVYRALLPACLYPHGRWKIAVTDIDGGLCDQSWDFVLKCDQHEKQAETREDKSEQDEKGLDEVKDAALRCTAEPYPLAAMDNRAKAVVSRPDYNDVFDVGGFVHVEWDATAWRDHGVDLVSIALWRVKDQVAHKCMDILAHARLKGALDSKLPATLAPDTHYTISVSSGRERRVLSELFELRHPQEEVVPLLPLADVPAANSFSAFTPPPPGTRVRVCATAEYSTLLDESTAASADSSGDDTSHGSDGGHVDGSTPTKAPVPHSWSSGEDDGMGDHSAPHQERSTEEGRSQRQCVSSDGKESRTNDSGAPAAGPLGAEDTATQPGAHVTKGSIECVLDADEVDCRGMGGVVASTKGNSILVDFASFSCWIPGRDLLLITTPPSHE